MSPYLSAYAMRLRRVTMAWKNAAGYQYGIDLRVAMKRFAQPECLPDYDNQQ